MKVQMKQDGTIDVDLFDAVDALGERGKEQLARYCVEGLMPSVRKDVVNLFLESASSEALVDELNYRGYKVEKF